MVPCFHRGSRACAQACRSRIGGSGHETITDGTPAGVVAPEPAMSFSALRAAGLPLALLLAACGTAEAPKVERPAPTVEVLAVREGAVTDSLEAIGTLRANESLSVQPEVAGRVTAIGFREGQPVKAGQLLVQLDDAQVRAELDQAVAARDLAVADLGRAEELLPGGLIARSEFERLKAQAAIQGAAVERARATLRKTRIQAPFDGTAGLRQFSPGELVQPGQALVTVVSLSPVKLDVPVPESQASVIRPGLAVTAAIPALPGLEARGRVLALEPVLDGAARALRVRLALDNPGARLQPGMTAQVRFLVAQGRPALLVPEQAVVAQGGSQVVHVVRDGKAVPVTVSTGTRAGGEVEVRSGLAAGDTVVVSGQNKLNRPAQPVRAVPYEALPEGAASAAVAPGSAAGTEG